MQYFLNYIIGIQQPPNPKTTIGSVVHKALEILSLKKLADQNGLSEVDAEELGIIPKDIIEPDYCIRRAFNHYKTIEQNLWTEKEYDECSRVTYLVLDYMDGVLDPRNMNIVVSEQTFDFEIDRPWAKYNFELPDGQVIKGTLAVKGSMDLITNPSDGVLSYIDWKSGARKSWSTGKVKEYEDLMEDKQLLLYYLALRHTFPEYKTIIMNIVFIKDGGPYTLVFDDDDIPRIEDMLMETFNKIKKIKRPKLRNDWICQKLCHYGKTKYGDSNQTICQHFHREIDYNGIDQVTLDYADLSRLKKYSGGGGRQAQS